ncbi:hypothetical protein ACWGK7_19185 (plasmid) [Sphingomonas aurantiaca]
MTSKAVDLTVPGVPGFILQMMKGKSRAERKHLSSWLGIEGLLMRAPRIDGQCVADGRYTQTLKLLAKEGRLDAHQSDGHIRYGGHY